MRIGGYSILFDPVGVIPHQFKNLNVIVVTHEHADHFDKKLLVELHKNTRAMILTTPFVAKQLTGLGDSISAMKPGDSFEVAKDVTIYAEKSEHSANQALTFFIETKMATVFHPNDSSYYPELASLRDKYRPSIMLFVGNSMEELLRISRVMKPGVIVTYNYPGVKPIKAPDTMVVTLKQFEWYYYPDKFRGAYN